MNIEIEEDGDEVARIRLTDSNEAVANTLRRAMMVKTPTLSVQHLDIIKNESGLFDEILAHRIGQVPLNIPDNLESDDTVTLALKQEGPVKVTAGDLKADKEDAEARDPDTVIVELMEGQEVDLEAEAELGTGEEHTKHQGGTVGYEKVDDGEFLFRIESTSGYDNMELLQEAVERVKQDLDEFEEAVEEL